MVFYKKTAQVYDNFFKNPHSVMELGNSLDFYSSETWPGMRTHNLLEIQNEKIQEFAKFFAKRLADSVFYGLTKFQLDLRFHKNDLYNNDDANYGWIHNDEIDLAGLVYLNLEEPSMLTGTSIFDKITAKSFDVFDYDSRKELNLNKNVTDQYLQDLEENRKQFVETINMGNKFNRLVAYDAEQWHRPNNYKVKTLPRFSLLFFINKAEFVNLSSLVNVKSNWSDE